MSAHPVPYGTERVERVGLDRAVAGLGGQGRCLGGRLQRSILVAQIQPDAGEDAQRLRLGAAVSHLAVQGQGIGQVVVGGVEATQQVVCLAEVRQVDRLVLAGAEFPLQVASARPWCSAARSRSPCSQ